jgi:hypothetical protein
MKLTEETLSTRGETCPSATLSTTNPTPTDPGLCALHGVEVSIQHRSPVALAVGYSVGGNLNGPQNRSER